MPPGYPWGMLEVYTPEGYNHNPHISQFSQQVMASAPPVVHVSPAVSNEIRHVVPPVMNVVPVVNDVVYHPTPSPSEGIGFYDIMDDFQDQFNEMRKEMKALRGKELFG